MKLFTIKWTITAVVVSLCCPVVANENARPENCTWCHGASAQGYWIAPRLAGQRNQYIEKQLLDFSNHTRDNPSSQQYMWGAVVAVSPEVARELADYFSSLPPKPANDGHSELANVGRAIYEEGVPESNIVSCIVCHGPNAEGVREIPRLGGLAYDYLKRRLAQWGQGYHASAQPMPLVASTLSASQIEALASYLSFIK
jgi:cytochrome c553